MVVNIFYAEEFFNEVKAFEMDDSYDIYKLNHYVEIYKNNGVKYIESKDNDLSYLSRFTDLQYLGVPRDVENIEMIYNLKMLKGLKIYSSSLMKINLAVFDQLEYLWIIEDVTIRNFDFLYKIQFLYCQQWSNRDLLHLRSAINLKRLYLDYNKKLETINGIEMLKNITELHINYCTKLVDISKIVELSDTIVKLSIIDCTKIQNYNCLSSLQKLYELVMVNIHSKKRNSVESVDFLSTMVNLTRFRTNFRILDGNLLPLINMKDVQISEFFSNYNVKDRNLPHETVLFKIDEYNLTTVKLDSLENGVDDDRIVWMDQS